MNMCLSIWKAELLVKHREHTGWRQNGGRGLSKWGWPGKRWREPWKEGSAGTILDLEVCAFPRTRMEASLSR